MTINEQIEQLKSLQKEQYDNYEKSIEELYKQLTKDLYTNLCKSTNKWVKLLLNDGSLKIIKYEEVGLHEIEGYVISNDDYTVNYALFSLNEIKQALPLDKIDLKNLKKKLLI